MEQKEIQEQLIATVRDMLLTSCEKMGAQSIKHCWTRYDGTEVKLSLTIHPSGEKEEDPERELRTYAKAALVVFGEDPQIDKAIEEMAELTKSLLKYKQAKHGTPGIDKMVEVADSVREEREDVRIMMAHYLMDFCHCHLAAGNGCPGCQFDKPTSNDGDGECRLGVPSDWDF